MGAHPYLPAGLDLPGYVPLRLSQLEIVGPYLGASLFVLAAVWLLSGR
jgi:cholestenol delta-isomerase